MSVLEIVLLVAGAVIFILSFCIPVKKEQLSEDMKGLAAGEIKELVDEEVRRVRSEISTMGEEEMSQRQERSERSLERVSNEKIMAVSEYSDTVLEEIRKNHQEVVFLYDMLSDKHEKLSSDVQDAEKTVRNLLQEMKDQEITLREAAKEQHKESASEEKKPALAEESEDAFFAFPEPQGPPQTREEVYEAFHPVTAEPVKEETPEPEEQPTFVPFKPERVDAVPKADKKKTKTPTKKPVKTATPVTVPEKPADYVKESKPSDVELLLGGNGKVAPTKGRGHGNNNERILELHREGKSNMAIAKELGLGLGEVKLVIDLYQG